MLWLRIKHWFIQKVLRRKPLCRCCTFINEPIYGEAEPWTGQYECPVCEVCDEYNPNTGKRTW